MANCRRHVAASRRQFLRLSAFSRGATNFRLESDIWSATRDVGLVQTLYQHQDVLSVRARIPQHIVKYPNRLTFRSEALPRTQDPSLSTFVIHSYLNSDIGAGTWELWGESMNLKKNAEHSLSFCECTWKVRSNTFRCVSG